MRFSKKQKKDFLLDIRLNTSDGILITFSLINVIAIKLLTVCIVPTLSHMFGLSRGSEKSLLERLAKATVKKNDKEEGNNNNKTGVWFIWFLVEELKAS